MTSKKGAMCCMAPERKTRTGKILEHTFPDERGLVVVWAGDGFAALFYVLRSLSGKCPAQDDTSPSAVAGGDPLAV
jgi:hypothetical protein